MNEQIAALSRIAARDEHDQYVFIALRGWHGRGHEGNYHAADKGFETCPHPQCVLVRQSQESAVPRLPERPASPPECCTIRQLQQINAERAKRWHQSDAGVQEWTPLEWAGAMCGEAGEAANAAKKLKRVRDKIQNLDQRSDRSGYTLQIAKEVADTVIYGALLCEAVGEDLQSAIADVFNRKSEEYGFPERLATGEAERPAPAAEPTTNHRCSKCGLRWQDLPGTELCGDCWRAVQSAPIAEPSAVTETPTRMGIRVVCATCGRTKTPIGRSSPLTVSYCNDECSGYRQSPLPGSLWPGETSEEFGYPVGEDGTVAASPAVGAPRKEPTDADKPQACEVEVREEQNPPRAEAQESGDSRGAQPNGYATGAAGVSGGAVAAPLLQIEQLPEQWEERAAEQCELACMPEMSEKQVTRLRETARTMSYASQQLKAHLPEVQGVLASLREEIAGLTKAYGMASEACAANHIRAEQAEAARDAARDALIALQQAARQVVIYAKASGGLGYRMYGLIDDMAALLPAAEGPRDAT